MHCTGLVFEEKQDKFQWIIAVFLLGLTAQIILNKSE